MIDAKPRSQSILLVFAVLFQQRFGFVQLMFIFTLCHTSSFFFSVNLMMIPTS